MTHKHNTNFENLNSILNIPKKHVLSFERRSNYLYLFKNHRQTFSWPGECLSSRLKVSKMWFGPTIRYILEPMRIFAAGKASLVLYDKLKTL